MRLAFRSLIILTIALGLTLPGCGGGGGDSDFFGLTPGPFTFGLPLPLLIGSTDTFTLSNKSDLEADVYVSGYKATGAPYSAGMKKYTLSPLETITLPLIGGGGVLGEGVAGGFLYVDSRDASTLDTDGLPTPVATSGYIYPTLESRLGGITPIADAYEGFVWRSSTLSTSVTPETRAVHISNMSVDFMAGGAIPKGLAMTLKEYDTAGDIVVDTMIFVPPNATFTHVPAGYGMVSAEPLGTADLFQIGMRGFERDFYTSIEQRYKRNFDTQMPNLRELGFEVDFGVDFGNNRHDFGLLMSNPTDEDQTIVLRGILRANGGEPLLTTPRFFIVGAHRTVFMATTTSKSFGLDVGEDSFFDDLFGEVLTATSFEAVTLSMQVPRDLNASVRRFDPAFNSFYVIQHGILRTAEAAALALRIEPFLGTGIFNDVLITNITNSDISMPVRMTTPGGTRYTLDTVTVPALSRYRWSPDGLQLREDPTDTIGPFVDRGCFRFSPPSGLLFRGRRREINNTDTIILITPQILRDLQNDDDF